MAYLADKPASSGGVVTRAELEAFSYDGRPLEVIDQSRGIRNPAELAATLSILSQPASQPAAPPEASDIESP